MPVLIITPDITADTGLGAAGCASGNQPWSGIRPAFNPKPISPSVNAKETTTGARSAKPTKPAKSAPPEIAPNRRNIARRQAALACEAAR